MSYIRILRLEYLWTLLPTWNTHRQRFINYHSRFLPLAKPKSRVVQPEFRPLYRRNTYICAWDEVADHSCTTLTTFTCKKVQIRKTLTKSALLLSCATIYTTIIMDRKHVISGRPNSRIAATSYTTASKCYMAWWGLHAAFIQRQSCRLRFTFNKEIWRIVQSVKCPGYGLNDWEMPVPLQPRTRFFLLSNIQTGCWTHPAFNQWVTGTLYPVVKRPGVKMTVHFHPVPRIQVHVHLHYPMCLQGVHRVTLTEYFKYHVHI